MRKSSQMNKSRVHEALCNCSRTFTVTVNSRELAISRGNPRRKINVAASRDHLFVRERTQVFVEIEDLIAAARLCSIRRVFRYREDEAQERDF
jgi:hypothetical protein